MPRLCRKKPLEAVGNHFGQIEFLRVNHSKVPLFMFVGCVSLDTPGFAFCRYVSEDYLSYRCFVRHLYHELQEEILSGVLFELRFF
jgi:hypothetical protein